MSGGVSIGSTFGAKRIYLIRNFRAARNNKPVDGQSKDAPTACKNADTLLARDQHR
jgi:hypothetical protein